MNDMSAFQLALMLMHSLWIAAGILAVIKGILLLTDEKKSSLRYTIVTGGLAVFLVIMIVCVVFVLNGDSIREETVSQAVVTFTTTEPATAQPDSRPFYAFVSANSHFILVIWMVGCLLFLLRLTGGLWYADKIIRRSSEPDGQALWILRNLISKLGVPDKIKLVQSTTVNSPLVMGIFRSVIVLPVGFASGISSLQLEAVLAHELIHITRRDYLVNLIQSVVESLFFFNPFVWIISGLIRREREHVCDDVVVSLGFNKLLYVRALAALEEARLQGNGLALSFAGNKKLLLHRIKRLMENSMKTHSFTEKLIPVVITVLGISCAAWLNIDRTPGYDSNRSLLAQADTIKKPAKPLPPSTVEVPVAPSVPQILFEDQISMPPDIDIDIDIPEIPEFEMPEIPDPVIPEFPDFGIYFMNPIEVDSIPFGAAYRKQFEFTARREQNRLSDFVHHNERAMNELTARMEAMQQEVQSMAELAQLRAAEIVQRDVSLAQEMVARHSESISRVQADIARQQAVTDERMRAVEAEVQEMQKQTESLQKALKEQLVKDGYLSAGDKIEKLQIDSNGHIRVNEIEIRESDRDTYRRILEKHNPGTGPRPQ